MTRIRADSRVAVRRQPYGRVWPGGNVAARSAILGLAALLALALLARPAAVQGQDVTVSEIAANPGEFNEQTVRVTGEVEDVLGPRAFTLEDDDLLFDEEVLVVAQRPLADRRAQAVDPQTLVDADVRVVGTVHQFNLDAFEERLGLDLDDSLLAEWAGRPAIVAWSIVPRPFVVAPPGVTVDQVTDDPSAYYGKTATVVGEIEDILGSRSFTIDGGDLLADEEILVVSALPIPAADDRPANGRLVEDADVRVTGLIRRFDSAELEGELGVDLDDSLHASWAGRPVIVARSIQAPVR
jgi:hypothetical protein